MRNDDDDDDIGGRRRKASQKDYDSVNIGESPSEAPSLVEQKRIEKLRMYKLKPD
jgi:hypothetical protein